MKTTIIAEIGTSHGGDLSKARDLIDAAAEAGADCAKFQLVIADEIIPKNAGMVRLPGGDTPLFDVFRGLERGLDFYAELKALTESRGMSFLCSPFGVESARMLARLGVEAYKIASPELNHYPLLDEVAGTGKPAFLSTGVSTLGDIEAALARFARSGGGNRVTLLHCVTSYPAPEEEYNLRVMASLSAIFGVPVGISDHSLDPVLVPALAVLEGAAAVEKHFTLSNAGGGLDDPIALAPEAFSRMVREIREAEAAVASGRGGEARKGLERAYGEERVLRVLGSGVKRLAPSEAGNYATTNRSVHALASIPEGGTFTERNTALLRTEKNLRPGLPPEFWGLILGKRARRPVPMGEGVVWEDIISP